MASQPMILMGRVGPSTIVRDDMPSLGGSPIRGAGQLDLHSSLGASFWPCSWRSSFPRVSTHEDAERNRKRARHLVPTKSALNEGRGGHSQALQHTRGNSSIREVVVHQPTLAGPVASELGHYARYYSGGDTANT
ncbi:hypothetical protein KY290_008171 [Solanum tuberosum]|uniref:Uncharacterized protein n=1 Tax=Solanum tuberosum TaxID=4113 RepID=A0ABQ7W9R2_SOLTU|nr:hypothetical protein KY290_008171 [Solanum tuberosum]